MNTKAEASLPYWVMTFAVGIAVGWFVEALKNWGYVPGSTSSNSVTGAHQREVGSLQQQGYIVRPMYSGQYPGGDLAISEARQGQELRPLITTNHRIDHHGTAVVHARARQNAWMRSAVGLAPYDPAQARFQHLRDRGRIASAASQGSRDKSAFHDTMDNKPQTPPGSRMIMVDECGRR